MVTAATDLTAAYCQEPPFQSAIEKLENDSNQQDQADAKAKLAGLKKVAQEAGKTEHDYNKDYEALKSKREESEAYHKKRKGQLDKKVPEQDRKRINQIVHCYDEQVAKLRSEWLSARNNLPTKQSRYAETQSQFADAEARYKKALDYKANQNDMDSLKVQTDKQIDAQNFRGAFYLVESDLTADLGKPLRKPPDYYHYLRERAKAFYDAGDALRIAKIALDQESATAQKKKKEYEDALAKRRENILKQIADEPFPVLATGAPTAETPADDAGTSTTNED